MPQLHHRAPDELIVQLDLLLTAGHCSVSTINKARGDDGTSTAENTEINKGCDTGRSQ
jgi:hypothetical protein